MEVKNPLSGQTLKTDTVTTSGSRPFVARILIELDVTKKISDKIWVGSENSGYIQSVILDDLPYYCVHCNSLGHLKEECHILHPQLNLAAKPLPVRRMDPLSSDPSDLAGIIVPTVTPVMPVEGAAYEVITPVVADLVENLSTVVLPVSPIGLFNENVAVEPEPNQCLVNSVAGPFVSPASLVPPMNSISVGEVRNLIENNCAVNLTASPSCADVVADSSDLSVNVVSGDGVPVSPNHAMVDCVGPSRDVASSFVNLAWDVASPYVNVELDLFLIVNELEGNAKYVNIPISVMSNTDLKAHVAWSMNNSILVQSDWLKLDESLSMPCVGEEEDFGDHVNDDMYSFMVGCVVDQAVLNGDAKRRKSKTKK
ncbi:hypothetical protein IEQ34_013965 [Dendrobium chrysotoxum]|uniref:DUF4283 domain-containing protein n=1 Tax=Dendrobium chrysotoxum TaxID=161865 RepID=A0AAV7GK34_DENCH|nr:hypothetical protein IEQ34_013965 [Dendrobium chrysotoxum]